MTIQGQPLSTADVGRGVVFQPKTDPARPPAHGKLHSWDARFVYVQFWAVELDAYREIPYAVDPAGLTWTTTPTDDPTPTAVELAMLDHARVMGETAFWSASEPAARLVRLGLLTSKTIEGGHRVYEITTAGLDALAAARMRGDLR